MSGTQTLVATDFGNGDIDRLVTRIGDAAVSVHAGCAPDPRRGAAPDALVPVVRVEFDTSMLRNTVAHGIGCAAGFVVHVE
jgi:hypothetical protein